MSYSKSPYQISVKKNNKNEFKYTIEKEEELIFERVDKNPPINLGERSDVGKRIISAIKHVVSLEHYKEDKPIQDQLIQQFFMECKKTLKKDLDSEDNLVENAIKEKNNFRDKKYRQSYSKITNMCKSYGWTLLDLLAEITKGLGVGVSVEIMRSYFAFFQTASGLRGINVILIGEPGQGKTWTIEGAIKLIPKENVIEGIPSESAFWDIYNGKDVTGLIFYLGDLGGGKSDDEKTIKFRNVLKQATSEGKAIRDTKPDGILSHEEITGYPCIAYTTADEKITNEQERSRSFIGYPPVADTKQMATFNQLIEGRGKSKEILEEIDSICKDFQGVVHHYGKNLDSYIMFNPYLYDVEELLRGDKNYNRKLKEFNGLVKIVSLFNDPYLIDLKKNEELDQNKDKITTNHLLLVTKQDNINALKLLNNASGLLTPEIDLANALLDNFDHYSDGDDQIYFKEEEDDISDYTDLLKSEVLDNEGTFDKTYCFTVSSLKQRFATKEWLQKNKTYLYSKLYRLMDHGSIIKIGNDKSNEIIYCLSPRFTKYIASGVPNFKDKNFRDGLKLFEMEYPAIYEKVKKRLWSDFKNEVNDVSFNTGNCQLFDLNWEKEDFIRME